MGIYNLRSPPFLPMTVDQICSHIIERLARAGKDSEWLDAEGMRSELSTILNCLPPACEGDVRRRALAGEASQEDLIIAEVDEEARLRCGANETYLLPAEELEPWMRRATGGGRKLIEALFVLGKKPKGKVRRALPQKSGGWQSKYDWVYDCKFCSSIASAPAVAELNIKIGQLRIACDGGEFMCTSGLHKPCDVFDYVMEQYRLKRATPAEFSVLQRRRHLLRNVSL